MRKIQKILRKKQRCKKGGRKGSLKLENEKNSDRKFSMRKLKKKKQTRGEKRKRLELVSPNRRRQPKKGLQLLKRNKKIRMKSLPRPRPRN